MDNQAHTLYMIYFAVINLVTLIIYGWDKFCAKKHCRRVPEATLLILAAIGGSIGAMTAMRLFRHKTLHLKFKYGVPLIFVLQIAGLVYLK
ncbi:MAG: DUF1294 domain-containing protein [Selenomonadaceae bacterium]|nr:DUF1294 domain-containing protein [Selenomonadaceae bacterium]